MWRCCWSFFFVGRASFVMSLFHGVNQWRVSLEGHEVFEGGREKEEAWGVEKQDLDPAPWQSTCSYMAPPMWIFGEAWDNCHPSTAILFRFGQCRLFFVSEVEIYPERPPILDDIKDRKTFAMGPTCHHAKHVSRRVPEREKCWKQYIDSWGEYFEEDSSYEVVSLSINVLKRKFSFFLDRPCIHHESEGIQVNYMLPQYMGTSWEAMRVSQAVK
jgi:hypothetical protein